MNPREKFHGIGFCDVIVIAHISEKKRRMRTVQALGVGYKCCRDRYLLDDSFSSSCCCQERRLRLSGKRRKGKAKLPWNRNKE